MQYVPPGSPGAYSFVDANAPYPGTASDGGVAGLIFVYMFQIAGGSADAGLSVGASAADFHVAL